MTNREFFDHTEQTHEFDVPFGANQTDVELQIKLHAERLHLHCPKVRYYRLNVEATHVDPDYGDAGDPIFDGIPDPDTGEVVGVSVMMPVEFHWDAPQKLLARYGIEEEHASLAVMSCRILDELQIVPRTGDRLQLLDAFYEINHVKYVDYFAQSQVPLSLVAVIEQLSTT